MHFFVAGHGVHLCQCLCDLLAVEHSAKLYFQFFIFTFFQGCFFDLIDLEFQKIQLTFLLLFIKTQFIQLFSTGSVPGIIFRHRFFQPGCFFLTIIIQIIQLPVRIQKRLVLMLSMNIQKQCGCFSHCGCRTDLTIDFTDTAAALQSATDNDLSIFRYNIHSGQLFYSLWIGHLKHQFRQGMVCPLPDHIPGSLFS